ncbi:MAG: hypothetical protein ACMXYG_04215 [Candidatus Woesearchaeota archaeon]
MDLAEKLEQEFDLFRSRNRLISMTSNFIPFPTEDFQKMLDELLIKGIINQQQNFVELGHGIGLNLVIASNYFRNVYGIELNSHLEKTTTQIIKKYGNKNSNIQHVSGNYITEEFRQLHEEKKTLTSTLWEEDITYRALQKLHKDYTMHGEDGFKLLDMPMNEFDVFYAFTWGVELPSIIESIALFGKHGSILLNATASKFQDLDEFNQKLDVMRIATINLSRYNIDVYRKS